jgi:hypothetical protein
MHVYPKCQSEWLVNNGSASGKAKKQCKPCGYQFTRTTPRGKPLQTKINTDPATGYAMSSWVSPVDPQADLAMHGGPYPNESWFVVAKLTARRDDISASVTTCRHRLRGRSV